MNDDSPKQIPVIYGAPIIATKDAQWLRNHPRLEPGALWLLPDDAIIIVPPETTAAVSIDDEEPVEPTSKGKDGVS